MCNCSSSPANICNQCASGNPCGCPPDYSVMPLPCSCCPSGYSLNPTYNGVIAKQCIANDVTNPKGLYALAIPCNTCVEITSSDCVVLPAVTCLGLPVGYTLTDLASFLCTPTFVLNILNIIRANPTTLADDFCQLVHSCGVPVTLGTPVFISSAFTLP